MVPYRAATASDAAARPLAVAVVVTAAAVGRALPAEPQEARAVVVAVALAVALVATAGRAHETTRPVAPAEGRAGAGVAATARAVGRPSSIVSLSAWLRCLGRA